jgi:hypothetical protein
MALTIGYFVFQGCCNQMQQTRAEAGQDRFRSTNSRCAALGAIAAHFEAADDDVEAAVALNLTFQTIKQVAFKFCDLATAEASHVNVVALRAAFIEMLFAFHVHEIKFVNQAVTLEQIESAIDGNPIDLRIDFAGPAENLASVEMLFGGFDDAENGAALAGHAQAAGHQFRLESARNLGLWQGHIVETQLQL